ncbi:MAG: recombinase family protein, partial [Streptosporangiaceae bacterium]
ITQANAVMFLRARHVTAHGRDPESEERNIARQRAYCRSAAERLGATIIREYVEHGGTGPIRSRPILSQMLGDLRTLLGVQHVLVFSLDRLARKPEDLYELEQAIQATGARLIEVSGLPVSAYYCNPNETGWYALTRTNATTRKGTP